jgi:hypothetical protein
VGEDLGKDEIWGMKDENKKPFVSPSPKKVFILPNSSIILYPGGGGSSRLFSLFSVYVSLKYN